MAFYIPASARRRRIVAASACALVLGAVLGVLFARATLPSVSDRVHSVQSQARQTSAGLRVIALHDTSVAVGSQGDAHGGTDLVLSRTRVELLREFKRAPWLSSTQKVTLLSGLDALVAITDRTTAAFGKAAEAFASQIDAAFAS